MKEKKMEVIQMMEVKSKIKDLLLLTERDGMDKLIECMEQNGFFIAPCSGSFHLSKEGGLAEHSLNVYKTMRIMAESLYDNLTYDYLDELIIVSILHDLGKMGQFGKPNYTENMIKDGRPTKSEPEQKYKRSETKPYITNPDLLNVPHEIRSIAIASKYINLTEQEQFAILYHNGLYGDLKYQISGKETPLYLLLHFADMWCSRVVEVE